MLAECDAALAAVASVMNLSADIVLCANGCPLPADDRKRILDHSVRIVDAALVRVEGVADSIELQFEDGSRLARAALFLKSKPCLASDLATRLGCRLRGSARVDVDTSWETDVPGVYAAGDIAAEKKFVAVAAASGAEAAVAIDGALAQEHFGGEWNGPLCANAEPVEPRLDSVGLKRV